MNLRTWKPAWKTALPRTLPCLAVVFLLFSAPAPAQDTAARTVLHLLDYVGTDYPEAVADGKVRNVDEFREMVEFTTQAASLLRTLPDHPQRTALAANADELARLVRAKVPAADIATAAGELRWAIIGAYHLQVAPRTPPDLTAGAKLYQQHCAACHGADGKGDGPAGATLDPKPSSFHDRERMAQRSVYSLYNTITLGVGGTGMAAFDRLTDEERWALAFHVAGFAVSKAERAHGEALWKGHKGREIFPDLVNLTALGTDELRSRYGAEATAIRSYLVTQPHALAQGKPAPITFARQKLDEALDAYRRGDQALAQRLAVQSYLEGFELIEVSLANVDPALMRQGERDMMAVRDLIGAKAPIASIEGAAKQAAATLEVVRERLDVGALSPGAVFVSSFVILLREGLEALLVVAAIIAFLTKAQRRDALRWVHAGWASALVAGLATWALARYAIQVTGAQRELTEGITGLIAAAMLVYVGFWLHSKASTHAWNHFIKGSVGAALAGRTLWTLALVSFLAVYREMFETVLFYQALWTQAGETGRGALGGGLAAGAVALAAIGWGIFRYSLRLPLGPFFTAMSALMCVLAVVLTGKGIAALQESGHIAATALDFISVTPLGIFPTAQSLGAQLFTLLVACIGFYFAGRGRRSRPRADA